MLIHATAVVLDGAAVLLTGLPGVGKSDLALRLIDRGWSLLADDQVMMGVDGGVLIAAAPSTIAGLIEVRGVGIVRIPHVARAPIALVVTLGAERERLPEPASVSYLGLTVPMTTLDPWSVSAAIKVTYAFAHARLALSAAGA